MITIKFIESDFQRYMKALTKLEQKVKTFGQDEMQRRCAVDYFQLVVKNIMQMNFPRPGYSKWYRNWKYEYGWSGYPSPWRLRGDLVSSLAAFKAPGGDGYVGGVPIGAMDQGGKSWFGKGRRGPVGGPRPIGPGSGSFKGYGWVGEHGGRGGKQPARPVFEPTMKEYASTGWQKRAKEASTELKKAWA